MVTTDTDPSAAAALFTEDIHPRLFFSPNDLPAWRQNSQSGSSGAASAEILARCKRYSDPASPGYVDPAQSPLELLDGFGGGRSNPASDALHCFAFGYALTGDEQWAAHGRRLLEAAAFAEAPLPDGGFESDVCYVSFGGQLTIAYDILYDTLPESLQSRLRHYIRERVVGTYARVALEPADAHTWGISTNPSWRNLEKYFLALAATWEGESDLPAAQHVIDLLRRGIHMGIDEGGMIHEGPSYGARDFEWLSFMAEVAMRMGLANLWEEEPRFAAIGHHWAHILLPGQRGQWNYCDAHPHGEGRPNIGLLLAARRLNDPVMQWAWAQTGGRDRYYDVGPVPECLTHNLGQVALWEDDKMTPETPDEAGWTASRLSGEGGIVTMRTGWRDHDTLFTLTASPRMPGCHIHQQVDAGHFCFYALGEAFSVDSGYGDILGRYHSVIRPQAEEPSRAPRGFGQMFFGGRLHRFATAADVDYACVNTADQWECHWAFRHALFVRAPGAEAYAILFDNVNAGGAFIRHQWLLNSSPENRIEPLQDGAIIHGQQHHLDLAFAYPANDEYPQPHSLNISTDTIDSHRQPNGDRYGMGKRPRLKADLWGYNGMLLTALVPRRHGDPRPSFCQSHGHEQLSLSIPLGEFTDTIVVACHSSGIDLGGIRGEATIAVVRRDGTGKPLWWAASNTYALAIDDIACRARSGAADVLAQGTL